MRRGVYRASVPARVLDLQARMTNARTRSRRWIEPVALATGILVIGLVAYIRMRPLPEEARYTGSERCASCHDGIYADWSRSQHTKMMRKADEPGVVVADFDSEDAGLRFAREEVVWAIGGKWEQQFMGHDGEDETLLAGAWLGLAGRWDFKGWDGWQVPVPRRRCHGCHTVGLDVETGTFVEPNIGCESCHGPGAWHASTFGLGRVHLGVGAALCGQCHTRGRSPSGEFFFPVGFRPGRDLEPHFEHSEPSPGQNSTDWWGNGHVRKRHQEYPAWRQGGHADSLDSLREGYDGRYGEVTRECLGCHAGDAILARGDKPGVDEATEGITCAVCHNTHGRLDALRTSCDTCHRGGAFFHETDRNEDHVACTADIGCVGCHMPQTVPIGGAFALHDHGPGVIPPEDTLQWGSPNSCANGGCHRGTAPDALQEAYNAHYRGLRRAEAAGPAPPKVPAVSRASGRDPVPTRAGGVFDG